MLGVHDEKLIQDSEIAKVPDLLNDPHIDLSTSVEAEGRAAILFVGTRISSRPTAAVPGHRNLPDTHQGWFKHLSSSQTGMTLPWAR